MSQMLSMQGRMNRVRYVGIILAAGVVTNIFTYVLWRATSNTEVAVLPGLPAFAVGLAGSVFMAFQVVKRLHDLARPGWHYWLLYLPLYNIYLGIVLLFKKGTDGDNRFGKDPLARTTCEKCGITFSKYLTGCPMCSKEPDEDCYFCEKCDVLFDYSSIRMGQRCPICKSHMKKIPWHTSIALTKVLNSTGSIMADGLARIEKQRKSMSDTDIVNALHTIKDTMNQALSALRIAQQGYQSD